MSWLCKVLKYSCDVFNCIQIFCMPRPVVYSKNRSCTGKTTFELEALSAHNRYRDIHDAPAMKLNMQLSMQAQAYAEYLAKTGKFEHSQDSTDGENLAMKCFGGTEKEPNGVFATTLWYDCFVFRNYNCLTLFHFHGCKYKSDSSFFEKKAAFLLS